MAEPDEIKKLTQSYFSKLKEAFGEQRSLKEYFESKSNSMLAEENHKLEQKKQSGIRVNEKILEAQKLQNKNYDINWNLDYCEFCKCEYWPENCTVYTMPRARITKRTAHLNTKHKLFSYKPKYKSYKDLLIKNAINRGIRLVYECKRCKSKNVVLSELKRIDTRTVKASALMSDKFRKLQIKPASSLLPTMNNTIRLANNQEVRRNVAPVVAKKKFASLQQKLKQSQIEQERAMSEKEKSFGNLASFLQNLT
jgi:hypothetical protein